MRRVVSVFLLVLLIVAAGAYCLAWYSQASQTKQAVEQAIARLNEKHTYLTYESITTSGFPSQVLVSIHKPRFSGRIDEMLKTAVGEAPEGSDKQAVENMQEWLEDILLDGQAVIGVNALSDEYSFGLSGNWVQNSKVGGQAVSMTTRQSGDFVCHLGLKRSGGILGSLWNFETLARDGAAVLRDFRKFDCMNPGYATTDTASGETLMSSGPGRFYITLDPQGTEQELRVYLQSADAEVTLAGDKIIAAYMKAIAPEYPLSTPFSIYGKQNIEVDFAYNGPADLQGDLKQTPLDIHLGKFILSNQVYNSTAHFHLTNGMNGPNRAAQIVFKAESQFSQQYDIVFREMVRSMLQQMATSNDPKLAEAKAMFEKYTPDQLYAIVYPAIPNFHSLGKLTQALDLSYLGNNEFTAGDITLADLDLSATPYGLTGKGSAKTALESPFPTANVVLTCRNCPTMVADLTAYAARVQKAVSYFDPQKAATMALDPELGKALGDFLIALADTPSRADKGALLIYTIISEPTGNFTIGGRRFNEIIALYNEYLGPIMKRQAEKMAPAS